MNKYTKTIYWILFILAVGYILWWVVYDLSGKNKDVPMLQTVPQVQYVPVLHGKG